MNADDKHPTPTPRAMQWRLGAILWLLGMASMLAPIVWALLLQWPSFQEALFVLLVSNLLYASLAYAVLLALGVAVGVALAPRVGLAAPALSAWIGRRPVWPALRPQLTSGLCGGLAGAAWLWVLARNTPDVLRPPPSAPEHDSAFIPIKLLAGITDELFMRWTVMTLLLWLVWRLLQRGQGAPGRGLLSTAVVLSALCSAALAYLPTAQNMAGVLTPPVLAFLLLGNTVFGLLMGALYARYGLEAAILAHTLALALSHSFL